MKQGQFNPAHAVETDTTTLIAVLMAFAVALEDCAKVAISGKYNQLSADEKRKWVWYGKNLLVAKPFYDGVYQTLSVHPKLKEKFSNEFAYIAQHLKLADVMLQDPRIQALLFDVDEPLSQSVVH